MGIGDSILLNSYDGPYTRQVQTFGNPSVDAKFNGTPFDAVSDPGLGIAAHLSIPSAVHSGLVLPAYTLNVAGLATYALTEALELSANVGYTRNNTGLLTAAPLMADARYVLGLRGPTDRLSYGVGVEWVQHWSHLVQGVPFVEFTGEVGRGTALGNDPARLTLGVKGISRGHALEVALGADVRASDAPAVDNPLPGLPLWMVFAQVIFHALGEQQAASCAQDCECDEGQSCVDERCMLVRVQTVTQTLETFTVSGWVQARDTGEVLPEAVVTIVGHDTLSG